MADWVTISSLATAGGTLVLAVATFSSVRSSNRSARVAERALMAGLRPVLMPSHLTDPAQKVGFVDNRWMMLPGGGGAAEVSAEAVYVAMSLRNVGNGIAVLHGWRFVPERVLSAERPPLEEFQRLSRDLYIPVGDIGFWQGAFRDPATPEFRAAAEAIEGRVPFTVDLLYGDHEGGQRTVSRFGMSSRADGDGWIVSASRHWNIDRDDPR
jgi:hypothetical protein